LTGSGEVEGMAGSSCIMDVIALPLFAELGGSKQAAAFLEIERHRRGRSLIWIDQEPLRGVVFVKIDKIRCFLAFLQD
jgi:hypothetical protein